MRVKCTITQEKLSRILNMFWGRMGSFLSLITNTICMECSTGAPFSEQLFRYSSRVYNYIAYDVICLIYISHSGPQLIHSGSFFMFTNFLTHVGNMFWFLSAPVLSNMHYVVPWVHKILTFIHFDFFWFFFTIFVFLYTLVLSCTNMTHQ